MVTENRRGKKRLLLLRWGKKLQLPKEFLIGDNKSNTLMLELDMGYLTFIIIIFLLENVGYCINLFGFFALALFLLNANLSSCCT